MKTISIFAAALSGLVASAAIAAPSETLSTPDVEAAAVAPAAATDNKSYCIKDTRTGSRVSRKTCKTRAQWAALGVDLDQR